MEKDRGHDLEAALRRSRVEADDDFVRRLAGDIEAATRSRGPSRTRWFGMGVALAATAILIAAMGAAMGGSVTYAPAAVVDAVNQTFSADNSNNSADTQTPADDEYKVKCNSGRGNLSETESGTHQTDSDTLINPHEGGTGPGESPTDDCDPGNSGPHDSGGD